ncbi:MAG: ABC transporter ATP-binding protein [Bacteriovorax sp.]|nr:ABC transporter ATP-binding protein [Bacteriovorax sp.]
MEVRTDVAIDIKNLSKSYPGRVALNDISFSVKKGSVHGFLGPNGAGKSTTMKILSGLIRESSGEFKVNGKIGFLPEHPPLYPNMSVQDYLQFVLAIYSPPQGNIQSNKECVRDVMEKTGLSHVTERLIGNLSKGYQQRVGIAQALVHSPEIIILDEPTVGLDPAAIADIRTLITKLKKDHTILFSTHQLHDVELLCSDITLINHGKIVVSGPLETILENLKTRMTIHARVENFGEAEKKKIMTQFHLESVDFTPDDKDKAKKNVFVKITAIAPDSLKKELSHFLADESIGLLEFGEVRLDLEELFKQMIH